MFYCRPCIWASCDNASIIFKVGFKDIVGSELGFTSHEVEPLELAGGVPKGPPCPAPFGTEPLTALPPFPLPPDLGRAVENVEGWGAEGAVLTFVVG